MDNMRKIAIMGKVFSDAKDVYVDIKIHDFEFNTLKIIHLPYAYKNENTEITPYPVVEFFIPSDIFGDDIPLEITLDTQLLKNEKVDFYFKKIKFNIITGWHYFNKQWYIITYYCIWYIKRCYRITFKRLFFFFGVKIIF